VCGMETQIVLAFVADGLGGATVSSARQ
jgi:hypothetical protein